MKRRNLFSMIVGWMGISVAAKAADHIPAILSDETFPASERFKLLYVQLKRAEDDAHRREVSLAGCSMAACGATAPENECTEDQWAWHPAYRDVLHLRKKFDAALRIIEERATAPGQAIVLYPCGCSATGMYDIPRYCSEHGSPTHLNECTVIQVAKRNRPTIAELEEILSQDPQPKIEILPNGQIIARS